MFTVYYKGFPVACDTAEEAVNFIDGWIAPVVEEEPETTTTTQTDDEKKEAARLARNAKARAKYKEKQAAKKKAAKKAKKKAAKAEEKKSSTTTSRLEDLPSPPPTTQRRPPGRRANTSPAVLRTLRHSPMPLTVEEIDTDLEKAGWGFTGKNRRGAIRATLDRLVKAGEIVRSERDLGDDGKIKIYQLANATPPGEEVDPEKYLEAMTPEQEQQADPEAAPFGPGVH